MAFSVRASPLFLKQLEKLSSQAKGQLALKIELAEKDPFRNKGISGYHRPMFRIRFQDRRKELRAIYSIQPPFLNLLCIVEREKQYKNLGKYLKMLGHR